MQTDTCAEFEQLETHELSVSSLGTTYKVLCVVQRGKLIDPSSCGSETDEHNHTFVLLRILIMHAMGYTTCDLWRPFYRTFFMV